MVLGLSIYGVITSIILNIELKNQFLKNLKQIVFLFSISIPFAFLDMGELLVLFPVFFILFYRFVFIDKKRLLEDFFLYFSCLSFFVESSQIWLMLCFMLLMISKLFVIDSAESNKLFILINNLYSFIFLILALAFRIYSESLIEANLSHFFGILSYLFLFVFILRYMGMLSPNRIDQVKNDLKMEDLLLFEVLTLFYIPLSILPLLKQRIIYSDPIYSILLIAIVFVLLSSLIAKKLTSKLKTVDEYAMSIYIINFIILLIFYIKTYSENNVVFVAFNAVNLLLYFLIRIVEHSNIKFKKILIPAFFLILTPTFTSPFFYEFIFLNNTLLLNDAILKIIVIASMFTPYLILNKSVLGMSKLPESDIIDQSIYSKLSLILICLIFYLVVVYYGKIQN